MSQGKGAIDEDWCLLDNQSTCNIFTNRRYLRNIRRAPNGRELHIKCNAGIALCTMIGDLPGFGIVWYHPTGIDNMLSLGKVQDTYRVTYDSAGGNHFLVHSPNRPKFVMSPKGLFCHDMAPKTGYILALRIEKKK